MIAANYMPEDVFTDMEKLIFSRGLLLNSIEVASISSGDNPDNSSGGSVSGVGEASIKLSISGIDYEGLKKLLAIFESSMRLMDVKKVDFSPKGKTAILQISTYYLKN